MLCGLGTKLRIIGCDCLIQSSEQSTNDILKLLLNDTNRIFISSGKIHDWMR